MKPVAVRTLVARFGGGSVGLDVIEYFAPRGAECTIIDMLQIGYACRSDHQMS